jgi:hypothetical protein
MYPQARKRVMGITESNKSRVLYWPHIPKEKPRVFSPRDCRQHRAIIKKAARKLRVSEIASGIFDLLPSLRRGGGVVPNESALERAHVQLSRAMMIEELL